MAKYMTDYDGRLMVTLGRLTPMKGKPYYVLTAYRTDPQRTDERVVITDSAGRMLKWKTIMEAISYASKHNMDVYSSTIAILGGTTTQR